MQEDRQESMRHVLLQVRAQTKLVRYMVMRIRYGRTEERGCPAEDPQQRAGRNKESNRRTAEKAKGICQSEIIARQKKIRKDCGRAPIGLPRIVPGNDYS